MKEKILILLRVDSNTIMQWTIGGSLIGVLLYIGLKVVVLPKFIIGGMLTIQIDLPIIIITAIAAFCGPLAGLIVGFFGSISTDLLFSGQIIAFGGINIVFGLIGFIVGLPNYSRFTDGKNLAKFILVSLLAFLLAIILYLVILIGIAGQSFEGTLLYNFLPFFSISFISLILIAPSIVWIADYLIHYGKDLWRSRTEGS
jgi:hypothetical protein